MAGYELTRPQPDVLRIAFTDEWDPRAHSEAMFREVLAALDDSETPMTMVIVAGDRRPVYEAKALQPARGILYHDNLSRVFIIASEAQTAVNHMNVTRAERGLPPIPMFAFDTEAQAQASM